MNNVENMFPWNVAVVNCSESHGNPAHSQLHNASEVDRVIPGCLLA